MAGRPIIPLPMGEHYHSFSLSIISSKHTEVGLLPSEHEFIIDTESGHYIVINWANHYIVVDGIFSPPAELQLVLTLLSGWPSYIPNKKLVQAITGDSPEKIAEIADAAYDAVLQQLHHRIEACQQRFQQIGMYIENVHQLGYKLSVYTNLMAGS